MDGRLEFLFDELVDKPVVYHKSFAKIAHSVTAGLLLSQICYWYSVMGKRGFYKTDEDFADELGMGLKELKLAKQKLIKLGLIRVEAKWIPARSYYTVDIEFIIKQISRL